jgi:predicted nuclease with TOPRIM domain
MQRSLRPDSPRPDSAVSMQTVEIACLKNVIEELHSDHNVMEKECNEWKKKYRDLKQENVNLAGVRSKEVKQVKMLQVRAPELEQQLAAKEKELVAV